MDVEEYEFLLKKRKIDQQELKLSVDKVLRQEDDPYMYCLLTQPKAVTIGDIFASQRDSYSFGRLFISENGGRIFLPLLERVIELDDMRFLSNGCLSFNWFTGGKFDYNKLEKLVFEFEEYVRVKSINTVNLYIKEQQLVKFKSKKFNALVRVEKYNFIQRVLYKHSHQTGLEKYRNPRYINVDKFYNNHKIP
jgi:hypothetical protein